MENDTTNTELHPSIYAAPARGYYDIKDSTFLGNVEAFAEDLTKENLASYYKDMVDNTIETFFKERMKRNYTGNAVGFHFRSKPEIYNIKGLVDLGVSIEKQRHRCRKEKKLVVELCDDLDSMWAKVFFHLIHGYLTAINGYLVLRRGDVKMPTTFVPVTVEYVLYKLSQLALNSIEIA